MKDLIRLILFFTLISLPVFANIGFVTGGYVIPTPQTESVNDNSTAATPASFSVTPRSSTLQITCLDVDGCDAALGESGVADGAEVTIINMSTVNVTFFDVPTVSETSGTIALGQYDVIEFTYANDRWVQSSTYSNN